MTVGSCLVGFVYCTRVCDGCSVTAVRGLASGHSQRVLPRVRLLRMAAGKPGGTLFMWKGRARGLGLDMPHAETVKRHGYAGGPRRAGTEWDTTITLGCIQSQQLTEVTSAWVWRIVRLVHQPPQALFERRWRWAPAAHHTET